MAEGDDLDILVDLLLKYGHSRLHAPADVRVSELEAADERIKVLSDGLGDFTNRFQRQIAKDVRWRNSLVPFHRLPDELLVATLSFALQDLKDQPIYYYWLHACSLVCKRWANLVRSSPSFWSRISTKYPHPVMLRALDASQNAPIDLHYDWSDGVDTGLADFGAFLHLVCPSHLRWRSVELVMGPSDVACLAELSAPMLERLVAVSGGGEVIDHQLFRGTDRLRHVHLNRLSIPWNTSLLKDLDTLILQYCGRTGPSPQSLLDIIQASPGLRTLDLQQVTPADENIVIHTQPSGSIDLPHLDSMLLNLPAVTTRYLLAVVRIPRCRQVNIITQLALFTENTDSLVVLDTSFSQITSLFHTALLSATTLIIRISIRGMECHTQDPQHTFPFHIDLQDLVSIPEALEWLQHGILSAPRTPPIRVEIDTMALANIRFEIFSFLRSHLPIDSLSLAGLSPPDTDPYIRAVSEPLTPADGADAAWPLPRLRQLELNPAHTPECLIEMVLRRDGEDWGIVQGPPPKPPMQLQCIRLPWRMQGLYGKVWIHQLEGAVGPERITWSRD